MYTQGLGTPHRYLLEPPYTQGLGTPHRYLLEPPWVVRDEWRVEKLINMGDPIHQGENEITNERRDN